MTREALEELADRYLEALVAGWPQWAGLAPGAVYVENDQPLRPGEASWQTIERLGSYRHVLADPERGDVGIIANVVEHGQGGVLVVRLRSTPDGIAEIEQFVLRDPNGFEFYEQLGEPDPVWLEPVPEAARMSRDALSAAVWMYFQALEQNDGAGIYPFRADCERIEHGRRTVAQEESDGYGHADLAVDFTTLAVKEQYELGLMAFVSRARDRRTLVADVERGAVLGSSVFDFDGSLEAIHFANGATWTIPPYFRTPRSHHYNEAFKVVSGSYRYVEMTLLEVPFGTRPLWRPEPRVRLEVRPSVPVTSALVVDRSSLLRLATQFLEALVTHRPFDLPLAPDVVYGENGVRVAVGEGLWRSARAVTGQMVALADLERAQTVVLARIEENGLHAVLVASLRLAQGQVVSIETVVARPERLGEWGNLAGATNAMFTAPLLADLDPSAFASLPVALVEPPAAVTTRAEVLEALDRGLDAFARRTADAVPLAEGCTRRENGVAATGNPSGPAVDEERPEFRLFGGDLRASFEEGYRSRLARLRRGARVVDEEAGLAFQLAMLDYPGTTLAVEVPGVGPVACAPSFRWPCTDLHASIVKLDGGRVVHVETVVRRVPYGQAVAGDR